ncbi:MAG TPA: outer membrane protein assembly factor BamE [Stenotrophomonas sp.]
MKFNKQFLGLFLLAPVLLIAGCTHHVSRGLTAEGTVEEAVFPDERHLVQKGGSVPKPDHVRLVTPGLTKKQLRGLVGSPHFREGYGAREWDYLFHLQGPDAQMQQCRFKVVFDDKSLARSLLWAPASCAQLLAVVPTPAAPAQPAAAGRGFSVSTDTLFPYGKWSTRDMTGHGRARVQQIAAELRGASALQVVLRGYTDRSGSDKANLLLSQRRADSVREVMVGAGLPADVITARGMGESDSGACGEHLPRAEKIACMAPERRVEIVAQGSF